MNGGAGDGGRCPKRRAAPPPKPTEKIDAAAGAKRREEPRRGSDPRSLGEERDPDPTPKPTPRATSTPKPTRGQSHAQTDAEAKAHAETNVQPKPHAEENSSGKSLAEAVTKNETDPGRTEEDAEQVRCRGRRRKKSRKPSSQKEDTGEATSEKPKKAIAAHRPEPAKELLRAPAGHAGGAGGESQFGWYGSMLHDRFYSEWVQPLRRSVQRKNFRAGETPDRKRRPRFRISKSSNRRAIRRGRRIGRGGCETGDPSRSFARRTRQRRALRRKNQFRIKLGAMRRRIFDFDFDQRLS